MLITKSLNPCRLVRIFSDDASVRSVEPATVEALQPSPSRTSATVTAGGRVLPERGREQRGDEQGLPDEDRRDSADLVRQDAEHRRQREHPGDVQAEREPDDAEIGAVVQQVHGSHGHDRHHDAVRRGDGEDGVPRDDGPVGLDDRIDTLRPRRRSRTAR